MIRYRIRIDTLATQVPRYKLYEQLRLLHACKGRGELTWKRFVQVMNDPAHILFTAYVGAGTPLIGMASGVVCQTFSRSMLLIEEVIVKPINRREGVGTALMHCALEYARSRTAVDRVELTVGVDNAEAISLYSHLGFYDRHNNAMAFNVVREP